MLLLIMYYNGFYLLSNSFLNDKYSYCGDCCEIINISMIKLK